MPRRPRCESEQDHEWRPLPRSQNVEVCTKCGSRYPCRDEACGHLDCEERRGRPPVCAYCRKRLPAAEPGVVRHLEMRHEPVAVHEACCPPDVNNVVVVRFAPPRKSRAEIDREIGSGTKPP